MSSWPLKLIFKYFILSILSLWLFAAGISSLPTLDRDEALYVQASRQILETHTWTQINVQEKARHLKPPGIYWLQAGLVKLTTGAESYAMWPYRLVSLLGAWISVLGVFFFWRRSLGSPVALLAACFLAVSFLLNIEVHIANTDSVLLATMVLMQGALWRCYECYKNNKNYKNKNINFYIYIFWLAMAAGILIKGITPLVGFLTLGFIFIFDRSFKFWFFLRPALGLPILILLTLAWLVPISLGTDSNFLWDMFHGDALPKLVGGQESHGAWPGYFSGLLVLFLFPASILIPEAIKLAWVDRKKIHMRFLLAWIIPVWIFFECVPTKLPQYVLPVFPALVLILSLALLRNIKIENKYGRVLQKIYRMLWLVVALALGVVIWVLPNRIQNVHFLISLVACVLLLLGVLILWVGLLGNKNHKKLSYCILGILWIGVTIWPLVFSVILPDMKNFWMTEKLVSRLKTDGLWAQISAEHPLVISGYNEPSVIFNVGTDRVVLLDSMGDFVSQMKNHAPTTGVLLSTQLPVFYQNAKTANLKIKIIDEFDGFRYNGGHWEKLEIIRSLKN